MYLVFKASASLCSCWEQRLELSAWTSVTKWNTPSKFHQTCNVTCLKTFWNLARIMNIDLLSIRRQKTINSGIFQRLFSKCSHVIEPNHWPIHEKHLESVWWQSQTYGGTGSIVHWQWWRSANNVFVIVRSSCSTTATIASFSATQGRPDFVCIRSWCHLPKNIGHLLTFAGFTILNFFYCCLWTYFILYKWCSFLYSSWQL